MGLGRIGGKKRSENRLETIAIREADRSGTLAKVGEMSFLAWILNFVKGSIVILKNGSSFGVHIGGFNRRNN